MKNLEMCPVRAGQIWEFKNPRKPSKDRRFKIIGVFTSEGVPEHVLTVTVQNDDSPNFVGRINILRADRFRMTTTVYHLVEDVPPC